MLVGTRIDRHGAENSRNRVRRPFGTPFPPRTRRRPDTRDVVFGGAGVDGGGGRSPAFSQLFSDSIRQRFPCLSIAVDGRCCCDVFVRDFPRSKGVQNIFRPSPLMKRPRARRCLPHHPRWFLPESEDATILGVRSRCTDGRATGKGRVFLFFII